MATLESSPLAVLTFIVAPAVLTNASSVLAMSTSNRFARAADRTRALIKLLENKDPQTDPEAALHLGQIDRYGQRTRLLMRALAAFYLATGCFAAASLISLLGAVVAPLADWITVRPILILGLIIGVGGLGGLITGCFLLVQETRLALRSIRAETRFYRSRFTSFGKDY